MAPANPTASRAPPGKRAAKYPGPERSLRPGASSLRFFFHGTDCARRALGTPSSPACPLRQAAGLGARRAVRGRLRALPPPPKPLTRSRAPGDPGQEAVRQKGASTSCGRPGTAPHPHPRPRRGANAKASVAGAPAPVAAPPAPVAARPLPGPRLHPLGKRRLRLPRRRRLSLGPGRSSRCPAPPAAVPAVAACPPVAPTVSAAAPAPPPFPTSSSIVCAAVSRERNTFFKKKKEKENDTPSYIPLITTPPLGPIHPPFPLPFASHRLGAAASLARGLSAVRGGRGDRVLPGLGLFVCG